MGEENLICTLGDYSRPSHEGYRNTIELPIRNNVGVPLRSETIRVGAKGIWLISKDFGKERALRFIAIFHFTIKLAISFDSLQHDYYTTMGGFLLPNSLDHFISTGKDRKNLALIS
ncbi:hypothetical protein Tco_1575791 [Tanacetum coccineum]